MDKRKYIGMDVHQASISIAVSDAAGKVLMECIIETKAAHRPDPLNRGSHAGIQERLIGVLLDPGSAFRPVPLLVLLPLPGRLLVLAGDHVRVNLLGCPHRAMVQARRYRRQRF